MRVSDMDQYGELLEIVFWHQLNKQFNALIKNGYGIDDESRVIFKNFILKNEVFRKVTEKDLIDSLPLSLITDLAEIQILTHGLSEWTAAIKKINEKMVALDLDQASYEAFEVVEKLETEYQLTKRTDEKDDRELFTVIDQYETLCEKVDRDFATLIETLFYLKSTALNKIGTMFQINQSVRYSNDIMMVDFEKESNRNSILEVYKNEFCKPAKDAIGHLVSATSVFSDSEIVQFFNNIESDSGAKQSVLDFVNNEKAVFHNLNRMTRRFNAELSKRLNDNFSYDLPIINLNSFSFLEFPFPSA